MVIGHKIKKLRELKNLTQEFMANELGLNQSAYSKLESGSTEISYSKLEKVASVLGISIEDITKFDEQMVFNIMNNQNGQNGYIVNQSTPNDTERELYERQIATLQEENKYLKMMLEKVLMSGSSTSL
jgi:transcriptional regulator with XRE-family HTH domain